MDDRGQSADARGQFGAIKSMDDLPPKKALVAYLKKAKQLNDDGVKVERKTTPKKPLRVPADLAGSLKKNRKAQAAFDAFSPSKKRDYVEWLTDAKTDATRQKRLDTAIGWIAQGKSRNWKYER